MDQTENESCTEVVEVAGREGVTSCYRGRNGAWSFSLVQLVPCGLGAANQGAGTATADLGHVPLRQELEESQSPGCKQCFNRKQL